jgi:Holliday junction resolvase RusA-like endonuclease|tara:strand:- start:3405 stop:3749 length:345 start_codon:yes stop_codon:yes gene_type:complete
MTNSKTLVVPIRPITINQAWCGRKFKTPRYKKWREEMGWLVKGKGKVKWCNIELEFHIKHFATTDVDNLIKPVLDALEEGGVIENDKYVVSVKATKYKSSNERIIISLHELDRM